MAIKRTTLAGTPETSITFYSVGGHNHDGVSSSLIDTSKYSIFDFNPSLVGNDRNRRTLQDTNFNSFKTFIINTVNESVLSPAGVVLAPNSVGAANIVSNSITANELAANIVLVNNKIQSSNYSNTPGFESGWIISNTGNAEFNNVTIRGAIASSTVDIPNASSNNSFHIDSTGRIWSGSNSSSFSTAKFSVTNTGALKSLTGRIGPFDITESSFISSSYSPTNYMKIENYGDITIYSNPNSGPHANMVHQTTLVGEYIQVARTNDTVERYALIGSSNPDVSKINFSIMENNVAKFIATSDGAVGASSYMASPAFLASSYADLKRIYSRSTISIGTNANAGPVYTDNVIEIQTSASSFYPDHTGYAIYSYMGSGGWTTATLDFVCSNNWLSYNTTTPALRISQSGIWANATYYSSDLRLKENINDCKYGLDDILKLNPKEYNFIGEFTLDLNMNLNRRIGLIAQEVKEIIPEIVVQSENSGYYSIDYGSITPVLINAIKDLSSKIESLESRLQALEGV